MVEMQDLVKRAKDLADAIHKNDEKVAELDRLHEEQLGVQRELEATLVNLDVGISRVERNSLDVGKQLRTAVSYHRKLLAGMGESQDSAEVLRFLREWVLESGAFYKELENEGY